MLGRQRAGVFLSYARKDGEAFAVSLRARLQREVSDIAIKQDRLFLEGGIGWWKQITDAIDSVDFLVLVMTPAAMASGAVQKEWRYARQQGVCVYPVKGAPDQELHFSELPRWMSKAHFFDLKKEWESFIAHLRAGCHIARVPFMAPDLPPNFVERPSEFSGLKNLLLRGDHREAVGITTALQGAGGFGKTTLAAALCHDDDVIQAFDDGILWVTLGQQPNLLQAAIELYAGLTDERPSFVNAEDAAVKIAEKLAERTCLLVIDDVWDAAHLKPFLRGGKQCARLFTTRKSDIDVGAVRVEVDEMSAAESAALLQAGLPDLNPEKVRVLSDRLGNWPLALELGRATLKRLLDAHDTPAGAVHHLETALTKKGPGALPIERALLASFELLSLPNQNRLTELSIFPEDVAIPFAAAGELWRLDEFDTKEVAVEISRLSLLRMDLQNGTMGLHDVLRSWLKQRVANEAALHSRLVGAWPEWPRLPHEYAWRWLPWHLVQAGRTKDLPGILWDPEWVQAKLNATDVNALIADYEYLKPSREADLLQGALRLSAHVLAGHPQQLASQVVGRLLSCQTVPGIEQLTTRWVYVARTPWLRPIKAAFHPPGTPLQRTLEGHSDWAIAVALSADGRRAVSASSDRTLKVWDLERGIVQRTLEGHSAWVSGVALSADCRWAVSASADKTLKVWDLETGSVQRTLEGHSAGVMSVALSADERRAVSASYDGTLKVWDLETGIVQRTLEGHSAWVVGVALSADGRRAVSASADQTLKVWDLETGGVQRTLEGHSAGVLGVAVSADGRRAVSASDDDTLNVWDLETGNVQRTLEGHSAGVRGVAMSADGRRAVSASYDHTLKVWDLETGIVQRTLVGHSAVVSGVALRADGRLAMSASYDQTLKVWDLETDGAQRTLEGHSAGVRGVALSTDGRRAVSASADHTLKVWDLEMGRVQRTLEGHSTWVSGVALSADGRQAVSASYDHTLKVWDLETGIAQRTLEGHSYWVMGVALSADGRRAVSASYDHTLRVWDLETGEVQRTLYGHAAGVNGVALSTDGRRAVSASEDHTVKVWDLETGAVEQTLKGHSTWVRGVTLSTDGRRAVSASEDHTLKVWDLETASVQWTLEGHAAGVSSVALSADGRRAVSASWDKTLRVWDLETGALLSMLTCDAALLCCAVSGAQRVVTGDTAGQLYVLSLERGE